MKRNILFAPFWCTRVRNAEPLSLKILFVGKDSGKVHHFTHHILIYYPFGNNYKDLLLSYEREKKKKINGADDLPLHGH
jgi:hypothetical protein